MSSPQRLYFQSHRDHGIAHTGYRDIRFQEIFEVNLACLVRSRSVDIQQRILHRKCTDTRQIRLKPCHGNILDRSLHTRIFISLGNLARDDKIKRYRLNLQYLHRVRDISAQHLDLVLEIIQLVPIGIIEYRCGRAGDIRAGPLDRKFDSNSADLSHLGYRSLDIDVIPGSDRYFHPAGIRPPVFHVDSAPV